jgi:hypothetical protein
MSQYVIIGTSPFSDTSIAVGPYRSPQRVTDADAKLTHCGWNTEVCELLAVEDVELVVNDEGIEPS